MKNLKFRVKSPKHSEVLQKMLFGLGYEWAPYGKKVKHTEGEFLFTNHEGLMTFMPINCEKYFKNHKNQEIDTSFLDFFVDDEKQQKIAELEKTINIAQQQIEELKNAKDN